MGQVGLVWSCGAARCSCAVLRDTGVSFVVDVAVGRMVKRVERLIMVKP